MTLVRETGCSRDALNAGVSQRIGVQVGRVFQDQIRVRVEFSDGVLAVHNLHHGLGGRSPPSPRGPLPAIPYSQLPRRLGYKVPPRTPARSNFEGGVFQLLTRITCDPEFFNFFQLCDISTQKLQFSLTIR